MSRILIRNARLVNEGKVFDADVRVTCARIEKIASSIWGCRWCCIHFRRCVERTLSRVASGIQCTAALTLLNLTQE